MAFCSFSEGAALFDATPIENVFLMEHVPNAPDAALRVYLYMRMIALHPDLCDSLADMARALRMDEDTVYDQLSYWERQGLAQRTTDNPPTYVVLPVNAQNTHVATPMERDYYIYRDFQNRMQQMFGSKLMHPKEYDMARDWVEVMGYSQDAVLRLVDYGVKSSRSKEPEPSRVFSRLQKLVRQWEPRRIRTVEDIEMAIADEEGVALTAREVLKQLGLRRAPSVPELDMVRRWTGEWGYTQAQIIEACQATTSAQSPTFKYLDGILRGRREEDDGQWRDLSDTLRELNPRSAQPTPDQITRYKALIAQGFTPEIIRLAAVQCHRLNKERFDDLEWRLNVWRAEGVHTAEEADAYMKRMGQLSRQLRAVFQRAGSDRRPSYGELEKFRQWMDVYPAELIDFAAECAQGAGGSMAYMEKLLESWQAAGIATVEAAKTQHEAWRANRIGQAGQGSAPANPALNYEQREYKDEDFGEDFFVDLSQYAGEDEQA